MLLARVHRKISNQRQDFLHKLSTRLVKDHDGICIENLKLKGLVKTKLGKSFNDAAHGEFRRQLEYKAVWNRKWSARVDRFFASSKLHAACGTINTDLKLSDREWLCACGVLVDRDLSAALNIKFEGLDQMVVAARKTETENACGAYVSHLFGAMSVEARIPRL